MPASEDQRKGRGRPWNRGSCRGAAAAETAAAATLVEAAVGAADVTRGEDEAAAATYSALSEAAAQRVRATRPKGRHALDGRRGRRRWGKSPRPSAADEFRRGMELAGIAGQVHVAGAARGVGQPTLAAFLRPDEATSCASWQSDAIGRATEDALVAHGAERLAGRLAALGLSEVR